jgi:lipopolysaccharide export system permease protein
VIRLVDRYVGRAACLGILLVWMAMTILFVLFSLLGELRSAQNDYGTLDGLWFVALTMPRMAYQVFPVSALLGALVGLGGLAAANELVAFRTSGISRLRLALAALAGTLLLTVPVMIMGEWLAPAAEQQARAFRLSEMVGQAIIGGSRGVWMRDGLDIVNIQRPLLYADRGGQSVEFKDVVVYQFSDQADLEAITRAGSATTGGPLTLNRCRVGFGDYGGADTRSTGLGHRCGRTVGFMVTRPKFRRCGRWDYSSTGENGLTRHYQMRFRRRCCIPSRSSRWCSPECRFCSDRRVRTAPASGCFGMTVAGCS